MKKKYFINIAFLMALTTLILTSCEQRPIQNISTLPTSTVSTPSSADHSVDSETNSTDKLLSEGYNMENIRSSESYLSRIILQLNEIETFSSISHQPFGMEGANIDSSKYFDLLEKIDEQKALYYIVKLSTDLHSIEDAINEYLLSLQCDLNINLYFEDREKYNNEKKEKVSDINSHELITVRDIEEKALESLQNINNSNPVIPGPNNNLPGLDPNITNPQPNIPTVQIPKPIDPSEEINNKLRPQF